MSKKTAGKVGLIILCIAIAVASVFGLFGGIMGLAWTGEKGWLALIIGSAVAFIGSIFGIFLVIRGKRIPTLKKETRPARNVISWAVLAFISAASAVSFYFIGKNFAFSTTLIIIIIAPLGVVFLVSIFVLVFVWKKKTKDEIKDLPVEEVENTSEIDIEVQ